MHGGAAGTGAPIGNKNAFRHGHYTAEAETEYVSDLLGKAKRFAQLHGVHVWIIAHPRLLHRENGKLPVPTLYDISGSANWANKPDLGLIEPPSEEMREA
jgi:twinkle protein